MIRRSGRGPERPVAATKVAGRPWSATRVLARGEIGAVAVAVDLRGTAVVMWGQDPGTPPRERRIRVAEHARGAGRWWPATTLGTGHGSGLTLAVDGAGTVNALWGRTLGRPMPTARRAPGSAWRPAGAIPNVCCQPVTRVTPLGDAFVVEPFSAGDGTVWHRPAGTSVWSAMPEEIPAIVRPRAGPGIWYAAPGRRGSSTASSPRCGASGPRSPCRPACGRSSPARAATS